jgi:hypothetical protein
VNSVSSDFRLPYETVLAQWGREAAELREGDGLVGVLPRAMVDRRPWAQKTGPIESSEDASKRIYTGKTDNNNNM